jgi:hypothetical protein
MTSYRFLVVFDVIMAFFVFLSSQFVFFALNGKIVQGFGLFIDSRFVYNSIEEAPSTQTAPLPNYPLWIFLAMLIVNLGYLVFSRRKKN